MPSDERERRGGVAGRLPDGRGSEPTGIDRARRRPDAPPRKGAGRGPGAARRDEPELAADAPVDMPKGMRRDVEKAVSDSQHRQRVLQHVTAALAALDQRDGATAAPHLAWVKERVPRSGLVREAYGTALYLSEQYDEALSELAAYRRMTGRQDQNHLVADALRAVGGDESRIPELVQSMEADEEVDEANRVEGRIVWASWLADQGDVGAGRAVLRAVLPQADELEEHHLRVLYVAGDLAQRSGADDEARRHFEAIEAHAVGFFDTAERLTAL